MYTCAPACVHVSSCSLFIAAHGSCSFFVHYPGYYSGNPRETALRIASIPRVPATGLVLGVSDDAGVMGCISALTRRVPVVGRTLGVFAEYRRVPRVP